MAPRLANRLPGLRIALCCIAFAHAPQPATVAFTAHPEFHPRPAIPDSGYCARLDPDVFGWHRSPAGEPPTARIARF